jgi:hypothetical protein
MPVFVGCPKCGIKLSVPESLLGKRVRCASCATMFEAKEEVAPPPRPPARERVWDDTLPSSSDRPSSWDDDRYPRPPSRYDERFPPRPAPSRYDEYDDYGRPSTRRDQIPHRSGVILTLGIVSIIAGALGFCCYGIPAVVALPTGLSAWLLGQADLRQMDQGVMDGDGRSNTHGGIICGIIGTILGGLDVACGVAALFFNLYETAGL